MNRTAAVVALGAVLFLGACSQPENVIVPSSAPSASSTSPSQEATPSPARKLSAAFGESVIFPEGVSITVAAPSLVPASASAAGAVEGQIAVFDMTVKNSSKESVNAALMSYPKVSYGASGAQAQTASDIGAGLGSASFSTVLPGETQTIRVAFGIPPAELASARVEIQAPDLTGQPAIFKAS